MGRQSLSERHVSSAFENFGEDKLTRLRDTTNGYGKVTIFGKASISTGVHRNEHCGIDGIENNAQSDISSS
jgi:hypothetical protein